jgi:uncharacterized membrane protein
MSNDPFEGSDLMSAIPTETTSEQGETSDDMYLDSKSNVDKTANDGVGSAKTTGKDIESSDMTKKGVGAVETAGTDITGVSIKGSKQDSQPVSIKGPNYSTSFCRPRPTESKMGKKVSSWLLKVNGYLDIGGVSWGPHITVFTTFGICTIIGLLIFYLMKRELFISFFTGGVSMLWYGFIFFMIITTLVLFSHYLYWVAYFFELTVHLFHLTCNPLLDQKVSSLCCLFSDYVNWIIYYPSMICFLFAFLFILFIDIVILLPIFMFFGCMIGTLYSMLDKQKIPKGEDAVEVANEFINKSNVVEKGRMNVKNIQENLKKLGNLGSKLPGFKLPGFKLPGSNVPGYIKKMTNLAGAVVPAIAPGAPAATIASVPPAALAAAAAPAATL